jgi:hypothetical protein
MIEQKDDNRAITETKRSLLDDYFLQTTFAFQCALFVPVVLTAIFSISELAARETVLSLVQSRIASLKADFVEQTKAQTLGAKPIAISDKEVERLQEEKLIALKKIEVVENVKRNLQTLVALGADNSNSSLRGIQGLFSLSPTGPGALSRGSTNYMSSFIVASAEPLLLLSSDQLLALAVMACGAIGSMTSSLRSGQSLSLRAFVLGVASGFVAYLAIKGGKHLFLLQTQGEVVAFNPYGSAFAGLLAGLFTERAHQVLSSIVDDFVERIRAASSNSTK